MAHGRTRHNRSFKPLIIDVTGCSATREFEDGIPAYDDEIGDTLPELGLAARRNDGSLVRLGKRKIGAAVTESSGKKRNAAAVSYKNLVPLTREARIVEEIQIVERNQFLLKGYLNCLEYLVAQAEASKV